MRAFFVSDLHGHMDRYHTLFDQIEIESPDAVLFGGDLLPSRGSPSGKVEDLIRWLEHRLEGVREEVGTAFFAILGNDDPRYYETYLKDLDDNGLLHYIHFETVSFMDHHIIGYSYIPPTPFRLKDWEKYDVSLYTDPGCFPPEEGIRTAERPEREDANLTMAQDLQALQGQVPGNSTATGFDDRIGNSIGESISDSIGDGMAGRTNRGGISEGVGGGTGDGIICLFHSPPYGCSLDTANLHGKMVDYAPLDVHIGSFAIRRFIEHRQPLISLHGHVHESTRLTGRWSETFGGTHAFTAAHDGPELALVRFDTRYPAGATRELIPGTY